MTCSIGLREVFRRCRMTGVVLGTLLVLAGPGMAEGPRPVSLPLVKLEYPGKPRHIRMVYLRLAGVGDRAVDQPLLLDTGSSGMTVDCAVVLPEAMCSTDGILIDKETVIDGITVTTEKVVAQYGTYEEYGNVARAVVRLGSDGAQVATAAPIAFVIRTKKVRRSDGQIVGGPLWPRGLIGISPLGGIGPGQTIISPLAAVAVPEGLDRGYSIGDLGEDWAVCTIEDGNCPEVPALSVGVNLEDKDGWKFTRIARSDESFNFPVVAACLSFDDETACKPTLFDTGNSTIVVAGVAGKPLAKGVAVTLQTLGRWAFTTRYTPEVEFAPDLAHHIVGIRFFEGNRLSVNLDTGRIGLRMGTD